MGRLGTVCERIFSCWNWSCSLHSLKEILSSKEELYTWHNAGLSVDSRAIENALTILAVCGKASRHWPLLVDLRCYAWVKCFHENKANEGKNSTRL